MHEFPTPLEKITLRELCGIAAETYRRGWNAGTAGNFSIARLDQSLMWMSPSGVPKGELVPAQFIPVQMVDGLKSLSYAKPSDEMPLHATIYRTRPSARCVIHVHSPAVVKTSQRQEKLSTRGHEMQKVFGVSDHQDEISWHLIENSQDMHQLAAKVASSMNTTDVALVLRGHGAYVWGKSPQQALAAAEALEFLCAQQSTP